MIRIQSCPLTESQRHELNSQRHRTGLGAGPYLLVYLRKMMLSVFQHHVLWLFVLLHYYRQNVNFIDVMCFLPNVKVLGFLPWRTLISAQLMTGSELACLHRQCSPFAAWISPKEEFCLQQLIFSEAKGQGKPKRCWELAHAPSYLCSKWDSWSRAFTPPVFVPLGNRGRMTGCRTVQTLGKGTFHMPDE